MEVVSLQRWSHLIGSSEDKNLKNLIMHIFYLLYFPCLLPHIVQPFCSWRDLVRPGGHLNVIAIKLLRYPHSLTKH